jgi:hypothetical protein
VSGSPSFYYTKPPARNHHDLEDVLTLRAIQDRIYGPVELQSTQKPGIQLERSPYKVNHLQNAPRAYPFGNTTQVQKMTEFVATNHKVQGRALEKHHLLWKDVMNVLNLNLVLVLLFHFLFRFLLESGQGFIEKLNPSSVPYFKSRPNA